jgi:cytosine deaminase
MVRTGGKPFALTSVTLVDGTVRDVYIAKGVITAVMAPGLRHLDDLEYANLDLVGHVLLPAPAEPHAHLDRALLANRMTNPSGDLNGAIDQIRALFPSISASDIRSRALSAIAEAVSKGFTAIRTHSGCGSTLGIRSVEVLVDLRECLEDILEIQVVALAERGLTGVDGGTNRRALEAAMAIGADLVGGSPSFDEDPRAAVKELLAIARDFGRGIDLHVDETVVPGVLILKYLAEQVLKTGFDLPVTASHCVSLGMQDADVAREVCALVAAANISVITLPQTNLYLQGRSTDTGKPRGLTALAHLLEAGVRVAGGGDNWRDPFNPMGRIDPLETASLLVTAGHMNPENAYSSVSNEARAVMGLEKVQIEPGSKADLLAVRASSLTDAIASASENRVVIRAGRILVQTSVHREWDLELLDAIKTAAAESAFTF